MKWSKQSGPDVKDQFITHLQGQVESLTLQVLELQKHVLSITKPAAYRQVYGDGTKEGTEVVTLGQNLGLSPKAMPPYKVADEKMWERVASDFEKRTAATEGKPQ